MIALLLALAAVDPPAAPPSTIDGLPIAGLPRQSLPARGCAAYLFSGGKTRTLIAVASAEAATLRLALDGTATDYARGTQTGTAGLGFATTTQYVGGDVTATLDVTIQTRRDLTQGAVIDSGTLRIDRPGKDTMVLPIAGLIGCAA
ncbi:hypothetical protein [Sphingomonas radiodurans]|uniref:hypothetical protein n=1 Tax=Sphingomonas radiodurans TaxID=2890321 RepID=UPI001E5D59D8|nr:hypothetical protein [Sphingomonas radiodurans]WBH16915.1 hypothetical protein LLW23_01995 [Sphingomonas radiodurans]